ncbi:MAG: hypothetical protein VB122_03665 [Erysipelotrichales bacterium]|nr:hypothetical protein [Erysipelotrichales bacterium]
MAKELVCPICGEPTRVYMGNARKDGLCAKHANDLKKGKLVKCKECDAWHYIDEPCKCNSTIYEELPTDGFDKCVICGTETGGYAFCRKCYKEHTTEEMLNILNKKELVESMHNHETSFEEANDDEMNNTVIINSNNKSKCIGCGKPTDGLLFCTSCYYKYKDKEILVKITKCSNVELLDEDYEGRYTCKDGHVVKSKSERDIDNYLFEHGISHAYEKELPYGATNKEVLHPDFYLPNYLGDKKHVYIEHWGYNENNIQYTKTKKFKMPIYEKLGITLICTYEKTDTGRIDTVLDRKLNKQFIKEEAINYEE